MIVWVTNNKWIFIPAIIMVITIIGIRNLYRSEKFNNQSDYACRITIVLMNNISDYIKVQLKPPSKFSDFLNNTNRLIPTDDDMQAIISSNEIQSFKYHYLQKDNHPIVIAFSSKWNYAFVGIVQEDEEFFLRGFQMPKNRYYYLLEEPETEMRRYEKFSDYAKYMDMLNGFNKREK